MFSFRHLKMPRFRRRRILVLFLASTLVFTLYQLLFVAELNNDERKQMKASHNNKRQAAQNHKSSEASMNKANNPANQIDIPNDNAVNHIDVPKDNTVNQIDIPKDNAANEMNIPKENVNSVVNQIDIPKGAINLANAELSKQSKASEGKDTNNQISRKKITSVFKCKSSGKTITSDKVNDDYCDCPEDGSDEPMTSACQKSYFICKKHGPNHPRVVRSNCVNDGVCDCCDGSDEWDNRIINLNLPIKLQNKVHRFLAPCPVNC